MCDEQSNDIGDLVPDDTIVFRGCSKRNFLTQSKDGVQAEAFQKDGRNHRDGLSLASEIIESVRYFKKNYGAIHIRVGDIHALGRGLEVRYDATDPRHILIRNMPCIDRSPEERLQAESIASELAYIAQIASPIPIPVPPIINPE